MGSFVLIRGYWDFIAWQRDVLFCIFERRVKRSRKGEVIAERELRVTRVPRSLETSKM